MINYEKILEEARKGFNPEKQKDVEFYKKFFNILFKEALEASNIHTVNEIEQTNLFRLAKYMFDGGIFFEK